MRMISRGGGLSVLSAICVLVCSSTTSLWQLGGYGLGCQGKVCGSYKMCCTVKHHASVPDDA